jgi:hypothetical protein
MKVIDLPCPFEIFHPVNTTGFISLFFNFRYLPPRFSSVITTFGPEYSASGVTAPAGIRVIGAGISAGVSGLHQPPADAGIVESLMAGVGTGAVVGGTGTPAGVRGLHQPSVIPGIVNSIGAIAGGAIIWVIVGTGVCAGVKGLHQPPISPVDISGPGRLE